MFRTRASFELGCKSVLYLFLVLAFNGKASDATHKEFGCQFADEQYKMIQSNKKQPVWSDTTIESQPLQSIGTDNLTLFSEANIMNELSLFTRFVNEYVNDFEKTNITLASFFNNYEVPFEPKTYYKNDTRNTTDPASYLIQELLDLKANTSVSPYLVSAYVDPAEVKLHFSEDKFDFSNTSDNVEKLFRKRVQGHIAAVIKINSGDRTGYLLMDPGYTNGEKLFNPFIVYVMQDGKYPHGEFLAGSEHNNKGIKFALGGGEGNSFILAKHSSSNQTNVEHVLYYAHKPYCSFMENTVKANLLRLNHGIIARGPNGQRKAYLTFKISKKFDGFSLKLFGWKFDVVKEERKFKEVTEEDKDKIEKYFQIPREEVNIITGQLDMIRSDVLGKKNFMSMFSNLTERDNPKKYFFRKIMWFFKSSFSNVCTL